MIVNTHDDDTTLIRVKNVPLSAFDGQIKRNLELKGCEVKCIHRERLRVDGYLQLTNFETGDRLVITKKLDNPLPSTMTIGGKYRAIICNKGQPNQNARCSNCLQTGHLCKDFTRDKVCRHCKTEGHIRANCPALWENTNEQTEQYDGDDDEHDDDNDDNYKDDGEETDDDDDHHDMHKKESAIPEIRQIPRDTKTKSVAKDKNMSQPPSEQKAKKQRSKKNRH